MLRKINIICVGSLKKEYLKSLEKEYLQNINLIKIKESNVNTESEEILNIINKKNNTYSVLFDLEGNELSERLVFNIKDKYNKNYNLCFIIGGSCGVNYNVKKYCDIVLKLSDLTYSHQIFRISAILAIRKFIS